MALDDDPSVALEDEEEYPPVRRYGLNIPKVGPGGTAPTFEGPAYSTPNDYPPVGMTRNATSKVAPLEDSESENAYAPVTRSLASDARSPRPIAGPPMTSVNPRPTLPSITGAPPVGTQPRPSITGAPAMPPEAPPDVLGDVPGRVAAPTGPNVAHDVLAGNVTPPEWKDYKPPHVGVGRRILGAVVGGLQGLNDPRAGAQTARSIVFGPQLEKYNEDQQQYKDLLGQGELGEKYGEAQARLEHEQAGTEAERSRMGQEDANTDLARERINQLKEKPEDKFLYHDQDDQGNAIAVFQGQQGAYTKQLGYKGGAKPRQSTSPFEAYAYGSPTERQAAKDFLTFEKKQGERYEKPGEVEQRYSLYKRDPEAYKEMYGDRGAAQGSRDQAQAAKMLRYFDGQRKSIENDFTLDDSEKQKQLGDIDDLEKPYLDVAQPDSMRSSGSDRTSQDTNVGGPRSDEVEVINPSGEPGYIPRANLQKALKRGYKQAGAR